MLRVRVRVMGYGMVMVRVGVRLRVRVGGEPKFFFNVFWKWEPFLGS